MNNRLGSGSSYGGSPYGGSSFGGSPFGGSFDGSSVPETASASISIGPQGGYQTGQISPVSIQNKLYFQKLIFIIRTCIDS